MSLEIASNLSYKGPGYLDDRQKNRTLSDLKNWNFDEEPIPNGFKVLVETTTGGVTYKEAYVYCQGSTLDPGTGYFRKALLEEKEFTEVQDRVEQVEEDVQVAQETADSASSTASGAITRIETLENTIGADDTTGLKKRIKDSEDSITSISSRLDDPNTGLSKINTRLGQHNTSINNLNTKTGNLETSVDDINNELNDETTGIKARITNVETQIGDESSGILYRLDKEEIKSADFGNSITNLTTRMTSAETTIGSHTTSISGINESLTEMSGKIESLEEVTAGIPEIEDKIEDLTTTIGGSDSEGLRKRIYDLETTTTSLDTTVNRPTTGLVSKMSNAENNITSLGIRMNAVESSITNLGSRMTSAESGITRLGRNIRDLYSRVRPVEIKNIQFATGGFINWNDGSKIIPKFTWEYWWEGTKLGLEQVKGAWMTEGGLRKELEEPDTYTARDGVNTDTTYTIDAEVTVLMDGGEIDLRVLPFDITCLFRNKVYYGNTANPIQTDVDLKGLSGSKWIVNTAEDWKLEARTGTGYFCYAIPDTIFSSAGTFDMWEGGTNVKSLFNVTTAFIVVDGVSYTKIETSSPIGSNYKLIRFDNI